MNTPQGQGQKIDINMTDLVLNISPATIRTITGITAAMGQAEKADVDQDAPITLGDLWKMQKLEECDLWYLRSGMEDVAEATETSSPDLALLEPRGEQLLFRINNILLKIEAGVETRTVPMLTLESSFTAEVREWSTNMEATALLTTEMAYYNEGLATWEPLIEPVEDTTASGKLRPWEVSVRVEKNPISAAPTPDDPDTEVIAARPVGMSIQVISMDMLQMCMTKTALEVLTNLGQAFGDAVNQKEASRGEDFIDAPCIIKNETGYDFHVIPDETFQLPPGSSSAREVAVRSAGVVSLMYLEISEKKQHQSLLRTSVRAEQHEVVLKADKFEAARKLPVVKAEKRLFNLPETAGTKMAFVTQIDAVFGQKQVTIRAPVQIHNHMAVSVEAYYKAEGKMLKVGTIGPDQVFNPPLPAVYSSDSNFYFLPLEGDGFSASGEFNWKKECSEPVTLECKSAKSGHASFYISATRQMETVILEDTKESTAETFTVHLRPTVLLTNLLPYKMSFLLPNTNMSTTLAAGASLPMHNACIEKCALELFLSDGMTQDFSSKLELMKNTDELTVQTFTSQDGRETLNLGIHTEWINSTMHIELYSPFWMVNKTGQTLYYQGDETSTVTHPEDRKEALLFAFSAKNFFAKKKATLKVGNSEWSDKFSLDTVGSSGKVTCKDAGAVFEVGVSISLSSFNLTKVVVFTPYYMLMNKAKYDIECKEFITGADWITISAGECMPFYPKQSNKVRQMVARVKGATQETKSFLCNKLHTTLMQLDNQYGGIDVDCQVNESSTIVTFDQYYAGMAAVRIVNHTDKLTIEYTQKGTEGLPKTIGPQQTVLFTWQDALELKRELLWSCRDKKNQVNSLEKDTVEEFFADSDTKVYFTSFLDGMQRVIMFTQDLVLATMAQQAGELEMADQDITLALAGLGLSLVDNLEKRDICYISICSSGVIWETKKKRFKGMKLKDSETVEKHYQKFQHDTVEGKKAKPRVHTENKMEIDFGEMMMYKPKKCRVRRSFQHGIWINFKTSAHSTQLHAKMQHIQIDNQLPACVFSVVLAPVPPPKSVAAESVPKPFIELSMMKRNVEHSDIQQIKYFKVLIQEMALQADQGFINGMIAMFTSEGQIKLYKEKQMEHDKHVLQTSLQETLSTTVLAAGQKNYYDLLHFSPLKVHISFSQHGTAGNEKKQTVALHTNVIGLLLKSVGVTVTEIQDVIFKLAYFERENAFYSQPQIQSEATMHYTGQAIKQLYVLVLGLDVLGNPFGLITGVKEGVTDLFYEPIQGAVQGPEEFAEGLALGVRSLFGGVVGGAAGAVGRITGTLGKGLAALTMDDEYQRKRQEQLNKRPTDLKSGLAQGGKGLVMGVWDGVSGVVLKPVEGAKQEGAAGFFKGAGKGLIGLVARPTSGVVDFASTSLESIRKATDMSEEVKH